MRSSKALLSEFNSHMSLNSKLKPESKVFELNQAPPVKRSLVFERVETAISHPRTPKFQMSTLPQNSEISMEAGDVVYPDLPPSSYRSSPTTA